MAITGSPAHAVTANPAASSSSGGFQQIRPIFGPVLTTLTNQFGGDPVNSAVRNSTATVQVYDSVAGSLLKTVNIDEARRQGMRRVENLFSYSEDFSQAVWQVFQGSKVGNTVIDGIPCMEVSFTANAGASFYRLFSSIGGVLGNAYTTRYYIRAKSAGCKLRLANNDAGTSEIAIPQTWTTISHSAVADGTSNAFNILNGLDGAARNFYIATAQAEDVTSLGSTAPSEYVGGAGAGPFVEYFDTTNGNTVDANNVVIEAQGAPLFPVKTIDGYKWYDTKPDWAAGVAYAAGAEVNYNGHWYSTVAGGTDVATFGDTVTWVQQGIYSNIGLLVEPAATNVVFPSEDLTHSNIAKLNATISANSATAPNGTTSMDGIVPSAGTGTFKGVYYTDALAFPKAMSYRLRKGAAQWVFLITNGGASTADMAWFDLTNGVTGTVGSNIPNASITSNDGIYTVSIARASTVSINNIGVFCSDTDASTSYTGDGTTIGVHVWGWQSETGSVPTSYIPTTTAAVTRASETGNVNWPITGNFSNTEGCMVLELVPVSTKRAGAPRGIVDTANGSTPVSYFDATGALSSFDGTNAATNGVAYTAEPITKAVRWSTSANQLQVGVLLKGQYGATWTWGTATAYDGAFTLGTLIQLAVGMDEPLLIRNTPVIYDKDLGTAGIEARFS